MEEVKITGFVLKSLDYKEKDKLIEIFSLEQGKITALLRGCRTNKAKLKFAGSLFNLCEYTLSKNKDKFTVINASLTSSMFTLTQNYDAFISATIMLDIIRQTLQTQEKDEQTFVLVLKCLNKLCNNLTNSNLILLKFYLSILSLLGFKIDFNNCSNCLSNLNQSYFNFDSGSMVCKNCKSFYDTLITEGQLSLLKQVDETDINNLDNLEIDSKQIILLLKLLNKNLEMRTLTKIKSFCFSDAGENYG